jgi:hypothetical protein
MGFCLSLLYNNYKLDKILQSYEEKKLFTPSQIPNSEQDILNNCKNLDLKNTSLCFRENILLFFNYSDDGKEIIFEDNVYKIHEDVKEGIVLGKTTPLDYNFNFFNYIKTNGGICSEWTLLYKELCQKTNFNCSEAYNDGIKGLFYGHVYLVMSERSSYCKLDQTNVECKINE